MGSSRLAGFSTIRRHPAVARGCRHVTDPIQAGDEFSTAAEFGTAEFVAHVRSGELTDADSAYRCLDALDLLGG